MLVQFIYINQKILKMCFLKSSNLYVVYPQLYSTRHGCLNILAPLFMTTLTALLNLLLPPWVQEDFKFRETGNFIPIRPNRYEELSDNSILVFQKSCLNEMDLCLNEGAAAPLSLPLIHL